MFVCAECGASQPAEGRCIADGTPLVPIGDDLLLGTTIGAYRVARLLGIGGMGRVYKGVHPQIGSRVAIKVLSRECSDRRDLVDRFFAEAKAVNFIRHESIVNVLDLATLPDGRPYIVMEYLDGSPLAAIIDQAQRRGAPLPLGGIARLVAEVLDALGAAHGKGIVHRDLKPDNIYITPAGRPKVLDFGIAKLQPELGGSSTHTGSLLGTPHYMSPEQAAGRSVDLRADLYAIGVILFECATGQKPFVADALFDLLRKHVEAPPPSPRALRRDMPEGMEHVILTALAKQPEHRFASAHAMSMALQHATSGLPSDQWSPLSPPSSSRPASQGAWAPTPPASWASDQRPGAPQQTTQTAGQVGSQPRPASRKGLWIALGAMLLVGGGITAAVVAGGGGGEPKAAASGQGSARGSARGSAEVAVVTIETDDDDDFDEVDELVAQTLERMSPEAMAAMPELGAALKKYGGWRKIPKAEREKLGTAIITSTSNITVKAANDVAALLDVDPPTAGNGLGPDGWVVYRRFAAPAGFDPTKVDAAKHMQFAISEAKKLVPDAILFRIDANGVFPDGHADFTAVDHGSLDYRFISPSRLRRDPKKPIGGKQEKKCMFRVMIDKEGAWSAPLDGWDCKEKLIGPPKCSLVQVWKKALAMKAPKNALASIGYWANFSGVATWFFRIDDDDFKFSEQFRDDC
jgi:serine/threonine protein kinase